MKKVNISSMWEAGDIGKIKGVISKKYPNYSKSTFVDSCRNTSLFVYSWEKENKKVEHICIYIG